MSDIPKRDFLSYLPYELLSDIFNKAYKDAQPPRTPISRAFLPFQRRALFRRVKISSSAQFESLLEAYEGNSRLGGIVKVLEVDNVDEKATKNIRRVKSFFSTLVNLEHLRLGANCSSLVDLVLSLRIAHSDLPRLDTLEIAYSANAKKPFDSKVYCHLDAYPCLRRLEISAPEARSFACNTRGGRQIAKVRQLALRGDNVDEPATLSFVQNFPNLTSLALDTLDLLDTNYQPLVALLPVSLTSLSLYASSAIYSFSKPCDAHFPRLVNLEYVYLGQGTFSQNLIDSLRPLANLKTLGFGRRAFLSCGKLDELVLGPNRIPALQKLIFDQVEGKVGWQIGKDSDGMTLHPDFASNPWHLGPGWILPEWAGSDVRAPKEIEMVQLVERIRAKGLEVEGKTIEAFGVFEKWEYETVACAIAHGVHTSNFDECREMFGDDLLTRCCTKVTRTLTTCGAQSAESVTTSWLQS
ncbi:hypothetical protein JCM16303_002733 [Sporobolomyces ruberrimus]